jgi:STE24 endopeptidase
MKVHDSSSRAEHLSVKGSLRGLVLVLRVNAAVLALVAGVLLVLLVRGADHAELPLACTAVVVLLDLWSARSVRQRGMSPRTVARLLLAFVLALVQSVVAMVGAAEASAAFDFAVWLALTVWGGATAVTVAAATTAAVGRQSKETGPVPPFSDDEVARAKAYQKRIRRGSQLALVSSLGLLLVMAALGHRAHAAIDAVPLAVGLPLIVTVVHIVSNAPLIGLGAYRSLRIDRAFGLTSRSVSSWWRDARREVVASGATSLFVATLLWSAVRTVEPRWIAAWAALALGHAVTFGTRAVVVGRILPLAPAPASMQHMADEVAGGMHVPRTPVLVAPMRERRAAPNAFVAGLGPFRRIVVFDVLGDLEPAQVRAVIAHEVGHVAGRHLLWRLALTAAGDGVVVLALAIVGTLHGAWGASEVPFVLSVTTLVTIYVSLLQGAMSRRQERDADTFALDSTRDPQTFAAMIRSISVSNLVALTQGGIASMGCTHPSPTARMDAAARWATKHGAAV